MTVRIEMDGRVVEIEDPKVITLSEALRLVGEALLAQTYQFDLDTLRVDVDATLTLRGGESA